MFKNTFHKYTLGVTLTVLATTAVVMWFVATSRSHVLHVNEQWHNESKAATDQAYFYGRIHINFGYGGFIHNFKNFVLRQDFNLIPFIDENINDTYTAIGNYRAITTSESERESIDQFRRVVDAYVKQYEHAKQLINQGLDSSAIDQQVRVDDKFALQALDHLEKSIRDYNLRTEKTVDQEVADALAFFNWGSLLILLFIVVGAIIIFMLFRLTTGTKQLQNAKKYVDDIIQATPDALIVISNDGNILQSNIGAQHLFGYSNEELKGLNLEILIPERFRKKHIGYRKQSIISANPRSMLQSTQLAALSKQGIEIPVEISLSYTRQGNETQAIASIRDISERKKIEERLRLTSKVLEEASEGILILDHERKILELNEAFCYRTGYQREELLGKSISILRSGHHDPEYFEELWRDVNEQGQWKGEIWDRYKYGQLTPNLVTISAVKDESGIISHYVALFADITLIKEKEQRLEQLAHFDHLTGLANRMLFHDRLRASMHRANRSKTNCAMLYIDLDGFKHINDELGHEVGDEVLVKVGNRLKGAIREIDTAARLGGDEFAVILNELEDLDQTDSLSVRILEALTFSIKSENADLPITASIGISFYPEHGDTIERLIRCADQAMYYCKHHGKNSYCIFTAKMAKRK